MHTIGVFSSGVWRLRRELGHISGGAPVRRILRGDGLDAVAGWGFKPSARRARAVAAARGLPYLAMEDGFLRSRAPGAAEPSLSYVLDRTGIYYDGRGPSDLEALIRARRRDPARAARDAAPAIFAIRELGVSKYNLFDGAERERFRRAAGIDGAVLVVDQTLEDAAVDGAGVGRAGFRAMLAAAAAENPGSRILLKMHPETQIGRRRGYLDAALVAEASADCPAVRDAVAAGRVASLTERIAPIDVVRRVRRVYAVSSQFGFEALIAGAPVTTFGQSFYAGWGLTDDRAPQTGRRESVSLDCLVAAAFIDYAHYFSPGDRSPCGLAEVIAHLARDARGATAA